MNTLTRCIIAIALYALAYTYADFAVLSYTTAEGAYVEELTTPCDPRLNASAYLPTVAESPSYEPDLVFRTDGDLYAVALDLGAFFRNESRRRQSWGWLAENGGGAVNGEPEPEGLGFFARQRDRLQSTWQENPWKVAAIGAGGFLILDYFVFDSGEITAWGLIGSDRKSGTVEHGDAANSRANGNASTVVINGDGNTVNINNNDSRNTSEPTVVFPPVGQ